MAIIKVSEEGLKTVPGVFDALVEYFDVLEFAKIEHYPKTVVFYAEKKGEVPPGYERYEVTIIDDGGKLKIKDVREV